jgi:hypothetical protein
VRLRSSVIDVDRLNTCDRDAMFKLMDRTYANLRRATFEADLNAKRWVIQVHDPAAGQLAGFSTQVLLSVNIDGQLVRALFSGDTVIDRYHWGDIALAHAWGRLALSLIDSHPTEELYWFLTSKGFRTYKYLPLFFRQWHPRLGHSTPAWERAVTDALGTLVAPGHYHAATQVIVAAPGKDHVRPHLADPQARSLTDKHVRYFISRNPGYGRGDELCCLAPLTKGNFTRAAYRIIHPSSPSSLAG